DYDLTVLRVERDSQRFHLPDANLRLRAGDELLVKGARENILRMKQVPGIELVPELALQNATNTENGLSLHEVILLPGSPLIGRTPRGSLFRQRYGLQVLALSRHGGTVIQRLSEARLHMGDILLVQGERSQINALEQQGVVSVVGAVDEPAIPNGRAALAMAIFGGAIILGALNILPLSVAMLLGAVLVLVTRCITPEEAYRGMQWRVIILIASMLGLGTAIETSGAAEFIAGMVVDVLGTTSPFWLLTAFFVLTVVLTQPMSNQSAAVVVLPIAIQTALQLGLNPRSFAIMIALAASTSFITPLEPACLLVYGPGRYKFFDFVKVGSLLTLVVYAIAIGAVLMLWPVYGP
ncbi:MAG TPA: SLC13 family permease, partial [Aggregatilineales bacterium]|nr:SLC13 family permease [Aggregatilineales bacterium]